MLAIIITLSMLFLIFVIAMASFGMLTGIVAWMLANPVIVLCALLIVYVHHKNKKDDK